MAQTRVLVAVDPATGARITRRTARTYLAVVVIGDPAEGKAVAATWCGRPDLAEKALRKFSRPDARLAPVVEDPWAEAEAAPVVAEPEAVDRLGFATFNPETESLGEALPPDCYPPATRRPVLPGEPEPVAARVAEHGPVTLPGEDREAVAALRADAAAGRRVSLASLARALSDAPELPELPTRFAGGGFAGLQPWGNMPGYPQPGANPTAGTPAMG
jgi:hypothetical protein